MADKVLVTCQSSALGGVERRLLDEVEVLQEIGLEVWLAPSSFPGDAAWIVQMKDRGVRLYNWHPYKFIERQHVGFPFPMLGAWGRNRLGQQGFRFAHVAMPWTRVGLSRVHDLACADVPVCLGLHCTYPKESWDVRLDPYIERALGGVVSSYAVSEPVRQSFLANFDRLRKGMEIGVIHNGIDTKRFVARLDTRRAVRAELGLSLHDEVAICCGRLDDLKRPWISLAAFAHAKKKCPKLKLVYCGDGPLRSALENQATELAVRSEVIFTGFVADVPRYLAAADLFLSTSAGEGFALAPAEALSCGLPLILYDEPAQRAAYAACPSAILIDSTDAAIWSQAIERWSQTGTEVRDKFVALARDFATKNLDRSVMKNALRAFYAAQM